MGTSLELGQILLRFWNETGFEICRARKTDTQVWPPKCNRCWYNLHVCPDCGMHLTHARPSNYCDYHIQLHNVTDALRSL